MKKSCRSCKFKSHKSKKEPCISCHENSEWIPKHTAGKKSYYEYLEKHGLLINIAD